MSDEHFLLQSLLGKQCSNKDKVLHWFRDEIISRETWANVLGINRNTLRRWEEEIIKKRSPVKAYFYRNRKNQKGYDAYQRFLTLVIYQVKQTRPNGIAKATNKDVIDFFNQCHDGRSVWRILGRENFAQFIKDNNVY